MSVTADRAQIIKELRARANALHSGEMSETAKLCAKAADALGERQEVAVWMIERGYATGHGDTVGDMLGELVWQVRAEQKTLLTDVLAFIDEEANNRSAAGSEMSDYEREPRELAERIAAVLR